MPTGYYNSTGLPTSGMKGKIPWNKGVSCSDECKQKISLAHLGKPKLKLRVIKIDKVCLTCKKSYKVPPHRKDKSKYCSKICQCRGITPKKVTEETRKKISDGHKGSLNHNWKGGVTPLRVSAWKSSEYKLWRNQIFERDNYKCQECNIVGGTLNAHHILSWRNYPELRYKLDNGVTLCLSCHKKTESYLRRPKKQLVLT